MQTLDQTFEQIVGGLDMEVVEVTESAPKDGRITVMVNMPHIKKFGKDPMLSLTYGCDFAVKVGDIVRCPPTPRNNRWSDGIVTALEDNGYKGRVKFVRPKEK